MATLMKFVVVLLVFTLLLSVVSVVFNLVIFKMSLGNNKLESSYDSNAGNIGFVIESSSNTSGGSDE